MRCNSSCTTKTPQGGGHPVWVIRRATGADPAAGDLAPMVHILDALVPQTVDQLVDAFRHIDIPLPEQVIEVPSSRVQPVLAACMVLLATQMVEQLVTVPTNPDTVLLVFTRSPVPQMEDESEEEPPIVSHPAACALTAVVPQRCWPRVVPGLRPDGTSHVQWTPPPLPLLPDGSTASQGGIQKLGAVVPQIQVQIVSVEVPQFQFIDRVLAIPVVTQMWVPTVQTAQHIVVIPQVRVLGLGGRRSCELQRQVPAVHRQLLLMRYARFDGGYIFSVSPGVLLDEFPLCST